MKAARLIRVIGTRLVPVKKNAALVGKPLDLVLAMLAVYPDLAEALFQSGYWRPSVVCEEFDFIGPQLSQERDERLEWTGDLDYDPAHFDLAVANAAVAAA